MRNKHTIMLIFILFISIYCINNSYADIWDKQIIGFEIIYDTSEIDFIKYSSCCCNTIVNIKASELIFSLYLLF